MSYISGKVRNFEESQLPSSDLAKYHVIDKHLIKADLVTPVKISDVTEKSNFKDFVNYYVYEGSNYILWNINEEEHYALFFQSVNNRALYYNSSGYIKVYWNDNQEIYQYEQTMLEKIRRRLLPNSQFSIFNSK